MSEHVSQWSGPYTMQRAEESYALAERIDPGIAAQSREFWQTRTPTELECLKSGAWYANDGDQYMMACCFLEAGQGRGQMDAETFQLKADELFSAFKGQRDDFGTTYTAALGELARRAVKYVGGAKGQEMVRLANDLAVQAATLGI